MKWRKPTDKFIAFNSIWIDGSAFHIKCVCLKFQLLNTNITKWNNFKYQFSIFYFLINLSQIIFWKEHNDSLMPFKLFLNSSVAITIGTESIISTFFNCCVFKWNLSHFHWGTLDQCYQNYLPAVLLKLHYEIRSRLFLEKFLFIF